MKKRMAAAFLFLILVNAPAAFAVEPPIIVQGGGAVDPPIIIQGGGAPSAIADAGVLSYLRTLLDGIYGISWGV